jgi:hypothetical protein
MRSDDIDTAKATSIGALTTALAFTRHGHAVLPLTWPINVSGKLCCSCKKGAGCPASAKHPFGRLASNGLLSATTDEATVRRWFTDEPAANLGVGTDRLVVLDADQRHGGDETLAALEREHGFPPTWRVLTGGGGEHVIFKSPDAVTIRCSQAETNPLLGAGIDVRAQGGYIVAPPSRHISGRVYAWSVDHHPRDVALAALPEWLLERLHAERPGDGTAGRPDEPVANSTEHWRAVTGGIREYRDAAAASVIGHLLRRFVDPHLAAGLLDAWNQQYCVPPLDEPELRKIINRVAQRELQRREAADAQR